MKRPVLILAVALAACGKTPTEPDTFATPLTGSWSGVDAAGRTIEVGVAAPGRGRLVGCVGIAFDPVYRPNDRTVLPVEGFEADELVDFATTIDAAISWAFAGTRSTEDELRGIVTGDHWGGTALTLTRTGAIPGC